MISKISQGVVDKLSPDQQQLLRELEIRVIERPQEEITVGIKHNGKDPRGQELTERFRKELGVGLPHLLCAFGVKVKTFS